MNDKAHLAFFASSLPVGAIQDVLANLARVFAQRGHRCDLVTARLDELSTRVSGLYSGAADGMNGTAWLRAENDRLMTSLTAMSRRLESVEAAASRPAPSPEPVRGSALVLAVGQLREALGKSGPFSATLNSLRAVGGADPLVVSALEVLAPLAANGVATKNRLIAMFDVAAAGAARAAAPGARAGAEGAGGAGRHLREGDGKADEDQARPGGRLHAVREDDGEQHHAGDQSDDGIKDRDNHRCRYDVFLFLQIGAVGDHRSHAQR